MPPTAHEKHLFPTLDGIRGIAAILVAMRHIPYFDSFTFPKSYLAVDLFFILSGVVLANAYERRLRDGMSPATFSVLRVIRIYPLYFLGSAIGLAYWWHSGTMPPAVPVVLAFALLMLPNVTIQQPFPLNTPAWSLFSEMAANVVFAYAIKWLSNRVIAIVAVLAALGMLAILFVKGDLDVGYNRRTIPLGLVRVAYSFFVGIALYRLFCARRVAIAAAGRVPAMRGTLAAWAMALLVTLVLMAKPAPSLAPAFDFVAVTLLFPALIYGALATRPFGRSAGVFEFLGIISYPLYAIHAPLAHWLPALAGPHAPQAGAPGALWVGALFLALLLPLCWLLDRYVDVPVRRALTRLVNKPRGAARERSLAAHEGGK